MPLTPAAEVDVTPTLVQALLAAQHPDLAGMPLEVVASGWDNVVLRLGDDLAVRVPRREAAARLVVHEQEVLAVLAPRLPVAVPVPVRVGVPGDGGALGPVYPWRWSVVPWFAGRHAADLAPGDRGRLAVPLAGVLRALHTPAPADAPRNPVRGTPLADRDAAVRERVASGHVPHGGRVRAAWDDALAAPAWQGPAVWLHGDPHPGNLVVDEAGDLVAVVDFGDVTSGDPATDLATAWLTFDAGARATFRAALADVYPAGDPVWARARGWALCMGTAMVVHSDDDPVIAGIGAHALREALSEV